MLILLILLLLLLLLFHLLAAGEYHRQMEKFGIRTLRQTKPILTDLGTYLTKAIPDTKLTIKKYADVKFEYLSYCLKVTGR